MFVDLYEALYYSTWIFSSQTVASPDSEAVGGPCRNASLADGRDGCFGGKNWANPSLPRQDHKHLP